MELLVCTMQEPGLLERRNLFRQREGHMGRGNAGLVGQLTQTSRQRQPHGLRFIGDMVEKARAGAGVNGTAA